MAVAKVDLCHPRLSGSWVQPRQTSTNIVVFQQLLQRILLLFLQRIAGRQLLEPLTFVAPPDFLALVASAQIKSCATMLLFAASIVLGVTGLS